MTSLIGPDGSRWGYLGIDERKRVVLPCIGVLTAPPVGFKGLEIFARMGLVWMYLSKGFVSALKQMADGAVLYHSQQHRLSIA
jgi:hypothetical protein